MTEEQIEVTLASQVMEPDWPAEAREAMRQLSEWTAFKAERRKQARWRYRRAGVARIPNEPGDSFPVYTRDVNPWMCGAITQDPVEAGTKIAVELPDPSGATQFVGATVRRCTELTSGWHDLCLEFDRQTPSFEHQNIRRHRSSVALAECGS